MQTLPKNFQAFFKNINPSKTYINIASRAQRAIRSLMEDTDSPARELQIITFLQGSYKRATAIHTINDVDIVAWCNLAYKESANRVTRNQIFNLISSSISENDTYKNKIRYNDNSICIKIILEGIKIEILPVIKVYSKNYKFEPFYMFHPMDDHTLFEGWELTYSREHQKRLSTKNNICEGNFIPLIKIIKHLRDIDDSIANDNAYSYHIECLLYNIQNAIYDGPICKVIEQVFEFLSTLTPEKALNSNLLNTTNNKKLFKDDEWGISSYSIFHNKILDWYQKSKAANNEECESKAILFWQVLLGKEYFPFEPHS